MKTKIKQLINRILGMKLVYRMILIYVIGGLLPLSAIIGYLIHGTNQVLVSQAENAEIAELQTIGRQILELENTMTTVSSYFYFDDKLEEIAAKQYTDYQEMINDYRGYTAFKEYQSYYNTMISRISIFLQNQYAARQFGLCGCGCGHGGRGLVSESEYRGKRLRVDVSADQPAQI